MKHLLKKQWTCIYLMGSMCITGLAQTKLTFSYDPSGNQIERKFTTSASKNLNTEKETAIIPEQYIELENTELANYITIYPNPTKGKLRIAWNPIIADSVKDISITDSGSIFTLKPVIDINQDFIDVDLTSYASGLYLIHFVFEDQKLIVKKIIKN